MMAYRKNFVVAIKHNGRILREIEDVVTLPFGSEYSILLKNKDSRKAVANIEIDGQDVVDGKSIIVDPNDTVELKGFMKGMSVNNRFRFIKKTKQISDYRGDRLDDGLVRVEFRFEKQERNEDYIPVKPDWYVPFGHELYKGPSLRSGGPFIANTTQTLGSSYTYTNSVNCCLQHDVNVVDNDDGITVKGSKTKQGFYYGDTKPLESFSNVIVLKLRGVTKNKKAVKKAVGVKTRITCTTCGSRSKSSAQYCSRCSTYLH